MCRLDVLPNMKLVTDKIEHPIDRESFSKYDYNIFGDITCRLCGNPTCNYTGTDTWDLYHRSQLCYDWRMGCEINNG